MFAFLKSLFTRRSKQPILLVDQIITAMETQAYDALYVLLESPDIASVINTYGSQGCSPMVVAIREGDARLIRKLIRAGADVNARTSPTGFTVLLDMAVTQSNAQVVRTLLHHGADPLQTHSPILFTAIDRVDLKMVRAILEYYYDPSTMYGGMSPLDYSIHKSLGYPADNVQWEISRLFMETHRRYKEQQRQSYRSNHQSSARHHRRRRR